MKEDHEMDIFFQNCDGHMAADFFKFEVQKFFK